MKNALRSDIDILYLVIHLKNKPERKERIEANANAAGIQLHFIDAITPSTPNFDLHEGYRSREREKSRLPMLDTEHACLQSHRKALKAFLLTEHSHAVVLEDDALFIHDINSVLAQILDDVPSVDWLKLENRRGKLGSIFKSHGKYSTMAPVNATNGATAILYSKRGAEQVLQSLENYREPFDTHAQCYYNKKMLMLSVNPSICWEDLQAGSTTGTKRASANKSGFIPWLYCKIERVRNSTIKRIYARRIKCKSMNLHRHEIA